jgi:hypothetical protein
VHVIVSSVQVLTSNPLPESWSHFPAAKRRLIHVIDECAPANVILLSGDIHTGELSGVPRAAPSNTPSLSTATTTKIDKGTTKDTTTATVAAVETVDVDFDGLLEATSSGMTHACAQAWWGALCRLMNRSWTQHRVTDHAFLDDINFGSIDFRWKVSPSTTSSSSPSSSSSSSPSSVIVGHAVVNIHDRSGAIALRARVPLRDRGSFIAAADAASDDSGISTSAFVPSSYAFLRASPVSGKSFVDGAPPLLTQALVTVFGIDLRVAASVTLALLSFAVAAVGVYAVTRVAFALTNAVYAPHNRPVATGHGGDSTITHEKKNI